MHLHSLAELPQIAQEIIQLAKDYKIWEFDGEMGAGKTTLIKAICQELGVEENVSSPTFSIVNEYLSNKGCTIYHFDFYRIQDEEEAFDIGVEEYFESNHHCFLEWATLIPSYLPEKRLKISIQIVENDERIIDLQFV